MKFHRGLELLAGCRAWLAENGTRPKKEERGEDERCKADNLNSKLEASWVKSHNSAP